MPIPQELTSLDVSDLSNIAERDLSVRLTAIDLNSLSVADIKSLTNPTLKKSLMDLIRKGAELAASHQNHGSHGDHNTNSERFLELEFLKKINKGQ